MAFEQVDVIGGGNVENTENNENEARDPNTGEDGSYDPDLEVLGSYQPTERAVTGYSLGMRNVTGIFGLPYQFMPHVDPRITTGQSGMDGFGADYASNIIAGMPLLFMAPGKPSFMAGYSSDEKKSVLERVIGGVTGSSTVSVDDIISKNGRFYTFRYDVTPFYQVVNPMCRITARLLGIQDKQIDGKNLDNLNWMNVTMNSITALGSFLNDYLSIPFYIDTETQISESFSNSVTDTSLASTVDSFSDMGRELMFYLGYTPTLFGGLGSDLMSNYENLTDMLKGTFHDTIFASLADQVAAVATGGRLIFPKIWSDSDFSRSYNVTLKLRSPDLDNFSVWLNIIVPLCHILGFVSPRMVTDNPNAFMSPPLVRAMYKGFFNVDMGMITSADVTKGDDAQWNANGIPTSVDINLTITDLYDVMALTATKSDLFKFETMDNTAEMDYLMNLCGINIYKPEIGRMMDMYLVNFENKITDIPSNIWGNIRSDVGTAINNVFRGV